MAAAMDVVTSDAEEQVLDPRTLALIKYKDAVAAMQAADQLMAASQPTPTPPTVAERTKLAAQQGIMGLASRLAPGLQQQGNRMGAAQAQQAMTGGLAQLPAPNMAGMASGGIVGYADGGAVDTDVQRYTAQYRAIMAAVQNAGTPEQKAQLQQRLREIQSTFNPETIARAHMQMSGQGMADGGEVQGFQKGGLPTAGGREDDYVVTYDELGNPIYASDIARAVASDTTDTSEEGAARRAAYVALQAERPDLREIARTPERPTASEERVPTAGYGMGDRTGQGAALAGMASGVVDSVRSGLGSLVPRGMSDEGGSMTRRGLRTPVEGDADSGRSSSARTGRAAVAAQPDVPMDEGVAQLLDSGASGRRRGPRERVDYDVMGTLKELFGSQRNPVDRRGRPTGAPKPTTEPAADAPTAAPTAAPDAVDVLFDQPSPSETGPVRRFDQPSPGEMGPNATPAEYFRNQFRPAKAAAGAEAKTAAPQSRDSRDDRMRRIIAGLRGLGSQGVGGYAAGSAGEEQRLEQELIAEQERQRTAGMEERELGLRDREVTLMDQIRRQQLDADIRQRAEQALLRLEALGSAEQQFVQEQIGERTKNIDNIIENMNLSILTGNGDADDLQNQILALQERKAAIIEEALITLEQPDRSAAISAAEEAAYGSGAGGLTSDEDALVNSYLGN
jgi:hypothetical protein